MRLDRGQAHLQMRGDVRVGAPVQQLGGLAAAATHTTSYPSSPISPVSPVSPGSPLAPRPCS